MNSKIMSHQMSRRILVLLPAHALLFLLSYEIAMQLRFDFRVPGIERSIFWKTLPWVVLVKLLVFQRFGSFHGWWRYVTFADLATLLRACLLSSVAIGMIDYFAWSTFQIPRAVLVLDCGASILLIGGLRSSWRLMREHVWLSLVSNAGRRALLIGVERGGEALARQINSQPKLDYRIIGYLHDNPAHLGSRLGGIPFLGTPEEVVAIARDNDVADVLVIANSISGSQLRRIVDECRQAHFSLKMIPPVGDLLDGSYRLQIRDVDINDLLRRDPVQLDSASIGDMLGGRRVMVTGAGGSIGSEICRQIIRCQPACLMLVERAENNLYQVDRELIRVASDVPLIPCVADVCDQDRMESLFRQYRPEIVFHAAAHKHVPLMESNPGEAINNNVFGTKQVADLSHEYGVQRFVMISTDKAVNPTSVMGVSKQFAERYVMSHAETSSTKFVVVRFGNVLASTGSVVPLFQEQIRNGGPVTVTHPEMKRYFMTIPEASQLVLQAAAMGSGGQIFVLEMGELVKIVDLARELIRLSGCVEEEIGIEFTGVRPGEKLYEELYLDDEETLPTPHPKVRVAYHRPYTHDEVVASLEALRPVLHESEQTIRGVLKELAPEYSPTNVSERPDASNRDSSQMPVPG